jgi:hypothetical protein
MRIKCPNQEARGQQMGTKRARMSAMGAQRQKLGTSQTCRGQQLMALLPKPSYIYIIGGQQNLGSKSTGGQTTSTKLHLRQFEPPEDF